MKNKKRLRSIMVVLILLALLFSFPTVAQGVTQGVGNILKWPAETVSRVSSVVVRTAKTTLLLIGAYILISLGVGSALPAVAVGFIVVGLAVATYALWDWINPKEQELPEGQRPDNVNLGGLN